jgi:hypothetical protein
MTKEKENVFCPVPWNFMAIRSNGDLRVCCHANQSESKGILKDSNGYSLNAGTTNLLEARNSEIMKSMRKQMMKNEWPKECIRCQSEENNKLRSRRDYERENWFIDNDVVLEKTTKEGEIDVNDFPVHYIDLRFGNKCNLACRMCGPTDSSSWYKDYVSLNNTNYFYDTHGKVQLENDKNGKLKTDDYNWYESDKFWQQLEYLSKSIVHVYMAGGEPLLIDEHFQFLEKCIELGYAKLMILEYNTNLTFLNDRIIGLWSKFKQVRVGASVDGMGDIFEYQRYPGKWPAVLENLRFLDKQPKTILSWIALTVTNYNIFHIPEFIKWKVLESDFERINSSKKRPFITHHMCHSPKHLNVRSMPIELKEKAKKSFDELKDWGKSALDKDKYETLVTLCDGITGYMLAESYEGHWSDFITYTKKLDKIRGQNISQVVPEFQQYMV